ncbi:hydrolase [bacterium CG17_big_fil_post_rev_8_21_14_2_50_64_8]|nr:MAG: hydrolase [bacterium CG17_big_fil_post_rev_8_21_14_2_50_64_8]PJA75176.1 MAG: hydrolase [bacterium CG_4_9_14_3_um_filter_65_15]
MTTPTVPDRLLADRCVLVVVDIQERFRDLIHHMDEVMANTERLVRFARILDIPVLVTEHYPQGLGATAGEIAALWDDFRPIQKLHFSCCGCGDFNTALADTGRDQVILCGIETHVCIYQTAADLRRQGLQVAVAADAVSSCSRKNRKLGLNSLAELGVQCPGAQMIMFEILERADDPRFRELKDLLRE